MKKGFTLIELLAVIVILAIIALIATPIVLSIIDDTKESAMLSSANFYLDAVEHSIAKSVLDGKEVTDKPYQITSNGDICLVEYVDSCPTDKILKVEVNGEKPTSGTITITNGQIGAVTLNYGNNTIEKTTSGELVYSESPNPSNPSTPSTPSTPSNPSGSDEPICTLAQDVGDTGLSVGDKYNCKVKENMEDGYTFYVLRIEDDGRTHFIMDRNICINGSFATESDSCPVAWVSEEDYGCGSNGDGCAMNDKGPITAMNFLNTATQNWRDELSLNEVYDDENGQFTFELNGKARLPRGDEVSQYDFNSNNAFLYENMHFESYCIDEDGVQVECTDDLEPTTDGIADIYNHINGVYDYWTLSSSGNDGAVSVLYTGYLENSQVSNTMGVRPVITLSSDYISQ